MMHRAGAGLSRGGSPDEIAAVDSKKVFEQARIKATDN